MIPALKEAVERKIITEINSDLIKQLDSLSRKEIDDFLCEAVRHNDFDLVKFLFENPHKRIFRPNIVNCQDTLVRHLSLSGNLEILRYLTTSDNIAQEKLDPSFLDGYLLRFSATNNHLHVIKFLLTEKSIKDKIDIHICNDEAFTSACSHNHIEIVNFLLTSPEIEEHANIHASEDEGFICACHFGFLDLIKYLISFEEERGKIDIHAKNDDAFKSALKNNHLEILQFLIIDLNIERTDNINKHLIEFPNQQVEKLFKTRELQQNLTKKMINEKKIAQKMKI